MSDADLLKWADEYTTGQSGWELLGPRWAVILQERENTKTEKYALRGGHERDKILRDTV